MDEQLQALIGNSDKESTPASEDAINSDFYERITRLEQKLDKVISLLEKDVSIDETNDEKIGITEAEGKINENEEYRDSDDERKETNYYGS